MLIEVHIPPDKMSAILTLRDDGIRYEITEDEILQALKDAGVKYGIDLEAVRNIVRHPEFDKEYVVARGKPPIDGKNGKVVITKKIEENLPTTKGKVDLRELAARRRITVRKGEVIGRLERPTNGIPGMGVTGEMIQPKKGEPPKVKIEENLKVLEDGRIIAEKDGILRIENDRIYVEDVLFIKGDVDYSTGNIDFPGSVQINGDVKPGFVVRARGNVTVRGIVEAATIISYDDSINLSGVKGQDKGMIRAKWDVKAKFLESAHVEAGNDVIVEGPMTNSTVKAGNSVRALGRRGIIVGGIVTATKSIEAEEIGSPIGVRTVLEIGVDPELREKEKILEAQIKLDEENLEKLTLILKDLKRIKEKRGELPKDKEDLYRKVTQTMIHLRETIEQNKKELEDLRKKLENLKKDVSIVARKVIHPGVEITIFQRKISIDKPLKNVILTVSEKTGKIVVKRSAG